MTVTETHVCKNTYVLIDYITSTMKNRLVYVCVCVHYPSPDSKTTVQRP